MGSRPPQCLPPPQPAGNGPSPFRPPRLQAAVRGALPSAEPGPGPGAFPSTGGLSRPPSPTPTALHGSGGPSEGGGGGSLLFWGGSHRASRSHEAYSPVRPTLLVGPPPLQPTVSGSPSAAAGPPQPRARHRKSVLMNRAPPALRAPRRLGRSSPANPGCGHGGFAAARAPRPHE